VRLFGYPWATAARVGVGLAQIGEFSFILVQVARGAGLVGDDVYNATLAASLFSILFNALLVRHVPGWLDALWHFRARGPSVAEATESGGVVLCGFGRVGSEIGEALENVRGALHRHRAGSRHLRAKLRARGVPCVFGDAAHRALLARAGVARAPLVIVALPEIERARLAVPPRARSGPTCRCSRAPTVAPRRRRYARRAPPRSSSPSWRPRPL